MIKQLIMTCLIVIALCTTIDASPLNLNQITESVCRISSFNGNSGDYGSGTCIHETAQYYYILTNAHVVGDRQTVYCEFFKLGQKTNKKVAKVIWRKFQENTDIDLALVVIAKSEFSTIKPRVISLANPSYKMADGSYIYSAGCPNAQWSMSWEGRALGGDSRVLFIPPPEGGQSGSGLFVIVKKNDEYYTRLAGVITWRIGDPNKRYSLDDKGYPIQRGGAIPISTLYNLINNKTVVPLQTPVHWTKVSQITGYALCSDGQYYQTLWDNGGWTCRPPAGIAVTCWPPNPFRRQQRPPTQQPPEQIPLPLPDKPADNQPTQDPVVPSDLWGKEDDVTVAKLQAEIQELKNQVEAANTRIKSLLDANNTFAGEKKSLTDAIANKEAEIAKKEQELSLLNTKYQELNKKVSIFENDIKLKENSIAESQTQLKEQEDLIVTQSEELKQLNSSLEALSSEQVSLISNIKEEITTITTERNALGGSFIISILALCIYIFWNKKHGKEIVHDKVDTIQDAANVNIDKIQDALDAKLSSYVSDDTIKNIHDKIDTLQQSANTHVDNKQTDIDLWIEKAIEKHLPTLVQNIVNKDNEKATPVNVPISDKQEDGSPAAHPTETLKPSINILDKAKNSTFIKEFFKQKESNGEKTTDWAVLGILYREAINLLKQGKLYYQANNPLQGQQLTATKIEDWVENQFLQRSDMTELHNMDELLYDAMSGFLYKEAIRLLKDGKFNVLGAIETASTLDRWVRKELLQRLNVNFS